MSVPPIRSSWWVEDGKLLAGPTPAEYENISRLKKFLEYGLTAFLDLRDHREVFDGAPVVKYRHKTPSEVSYCNFPMLDGTAPETCEEMDDIVRMIDGWIENGKKVYVHCYGGHGRTGLVIACWLIKNKQVGAMKAVSMLYDFRKESSEELCKISCPQTTAQVMFALDYEKFLKNKNI
jgi:protein-tyrosine phosphatase